MDFRLLEEWQNEYYSHLRETIEEARVQSQAIIEGDELIKENPYAYAFYDWINPFEMGIHYIMFNKPIEYAHVRNKFDARTSSKVDRLRFRLSFRETFDYLRAIEKYCCWSLLAKIHCPSYCEDELFDSIQRNNFEKFSEICRNEHLDLSEVSFGGGLLGGAPDVNDDEQNNKESELPQEEKDARYLKELNLMGTSIEVINDYNSRLADRFSEKFSSLEGTDRLIAAHLVFYLILDILCYNTFEYLEVVTINEYLDNEKYHDLFAEAQRFYYHTFGELPSRLPMKAEFEVEDEEDDNDDNAIGNEGQFTFTKRATESTPEPQPTTAPTEGEKQVGDVTQEGRDLNEKPKKGRKPSIWLSEKYSMYTDTSVGLLLKAKIWDKLKKNLTLLPFPNYGSKRMEGDIKSFGAALLFYVFKQLGIASEDAIYGRSFERTMVVMGTESNVLQKNKFSAGPFARNSTTPHLEAISIVLPALCQLKEGKHLDIAKILAKGSDLVKVLVNGHTTLMEAYQYLTNKLPSIFEESSDNPTNNAEAGSD